MIKEEYVSYESAKLLKEAGFPQGTRYVRDSVRHLVRPIQPTQSQAMRWLREEKKKVVIFSIISPNVAVSYDLTPGYFTVDIFDAETGDYLDIEDLETTGPDMIGYSTYEAAAEAGIQAACKYIVQNSRCKS